MLHVLVTRVEQAGSAHCRNEKNTVAQPAAGPTEGYPSVGENAKKKLNTVIMEKTFHLGYV